MRVLHLNERKEIKILNETCLEWHILGMTQKPLGANYFTQMSQISQLIVGMNEEGNSRRGQSERHLKEASALFGYLYEVDSQIKLQEGQIKTENYCPLKMGKR